MRKPRVIIFDDDPTIVDVLEHFFSMKHYEIHSFHEPVACPLYENDQQECLHAPCADIIITDFQMPRMNGVALLNHQNRRGCKSDRRNKAVISGYVPEEYLVEIRKLGCAFFKKPIDLSELSAWVEECERRIDLSQPLGIKRKSLRYPVMHHITFSFDAQTPVFEGHIINISDSGLCLKTGMSLSKDQLLRIHTELPIACDRASVRWTKTVEKDLSLVGLSCC